jgi:hypothetical protein
MSRRPPYLEVILTLAVMAFIALVVAGSFTHRDDDAGRLTMRSAAPQ